MKKHPTTFAGLALALGAIAVGVITNDLSAATMLARRA
jgi:hypothetical protein